MSSLFVDNIDTSVSDLDKRRLRGIYYVSATNGTLDVLDRRLNEAWQIARSRYTKRSDYAYLQYANNHIPLEELVRILKRRDEELDKLRAFYEYQAALIDEYRYLEPGKDS